MFYLVCLYQKHIASASCWCIGRMLSNAERLLSISNCSSRGSQSGRLMWHFWCRWHRNCGLSICARIAWKKNKEMSLWKKFIMGYESVSVNWLKIAPSMVEKSIFSKWNVYLRTKKNVEHPDETFFYFIRDLQFSEIFLNK